MSEQFYLIRTDQYNSSEWGLLTEYQFDYNDHLIKHMYYKNDHQAVRQGAVVSASVLETGYGPQGLVQYFISLRDEITPVKAMKYKGCWDSQWGNLKELEDKSSVPLPGTIWGGRKFKTRNIKNGNWVFEDVKGRIWIAPNHPWGLVSFLEENFGTQSADSNATEVDNPEYDEVEE
ncbi:hypothetical protein DKZ22_11200 [Limosilactobacillus reuteri]|uniref:Uncharacterized protein n=1 Tax=Limosilactobacillus reuteri TaxID=1598 RepID=A0A855X8R4_LIMRT|nr:hypothetical protein [Limosilactobacillus reuteri]PWT34143.1 hypothetical protein DKZ21_00700 [Limosilactobacillus reuteri]PWT39343.1 hypothetical protein DKZ22_11200 [Limosilactobacillus reuteri]PWT45575.1 hypothetical protein DKZ25_00700 [Limosilactobacillus reuteri]PWT68187.1 hypothetical protein DKZ26_10595 [Limosilactobacillus reuteri]